MDAEMREAFGNLGIQVSDVERRLGGRIDSLEERFVGLRSEVYGSLHPPGGGGGGGSDGAPPTGSALPNGPAATPVSVQRPIAIRVSSTEGETAALRADVNRLLQLQEKQMKQLGIGVSIFQWLASPAGKKAVLQVITLACAAYAAVAAGRPAPAAPHPLPPVTESP